MSAPLCSLPSMSSPPILPPSFRLRLPPRSVRELIVTTAWVPEHTPLERVYRMFGSDPSLPGLAILRGRYPLGLLSKNALVERFSYRYSHELFGHKPVSEFMDPSPLVLQALSSLDSIEKILGEAPADERGDNGFLIVDGDDYLGIGTWQGLVRKVASRREEVFFFMAHHDALTGLPNRLSFMKELELRLFRGESGAVVYLDLNGFKEVNDRFGHEEGDRLLTFFAERLERALPPGSLAARLGGDEFAAILPSMDSVGPVEIFLAGLQTALCSPTSLEGKPYKISASMGRVLFPGPGLDMAGILRLADSRMYEEKRKRRRSDAPPILALEKGGDSSCPEIVSLDGLTALPDRQALYGCLEKRGAGRKEREGLLFLLLDLDHFARVNDLFGHEWGDHVLRETAQRLKGAVRQGDLVVRMGGDEFGVVLRGEWDPEASRRAADDILGAVARPFVLHGREYLLTASIGAASCGPEEAHCLEVVEHADTALNQAKESGRSRSHFFDPGEKQKRSERYAMIQELHRAVNRGAFQLFYQPILDCASGRVVGAEALLRWERETGEGVPPDFFVPILEEDGLIVPLGEWILETALRERTRWEREAGMAIFVSVNVSGVQISRPDFLTRFLRIIDRWGVSSGDLSIELTETVAMQDPSQAGKVLAALGERGVRSSLDDFGTGLSSLARLTRLPVGCLKIDRSFVSRVDERAEEGEIVRTLALLARRLSLTLCAEGVEREEERSFLADLGVEWIQGYLVSPPLPAGEFFERLAKNRWREA